MDYSKLDGLIPAVVQDHKSGEVLMVGFMNEEAWDVTRKSAAGTATLAAAGRDATTAGTSAGAIPRRLKRTLSRCRAVASRLLIVPTGQPSRDAASSWLRSSR